MYVRLPIYIGNHQACHIQIRILYVPSASALCTTHGKQRYQTLFHKILYLDMAGRSK